jgi:hypothetical protein
MNYKNILILSASIAFLSSCGEGTIEEVQDTPGQEGNTEINDSTSLSLKAGGIELVKVAGSPEFPGANLSIVSPSNPGSVNPGSVNFQFEVSGGEYELAAQTNDAETKGCSNSGKGQHIHLIIDNQPYEASYSTEHTTKAELEEGGHVALAFISRSYHESLKHEGAAVLLPFHVGDMEGGDIDTEAEHMFYSRPKGEYNIADAPNVFLDFYLINTTISEEGNYVIATIDDNQFKITEWAPYYMNGLAVGDHTIKLELFNAEGIFIEGPFNSVERTFKLVN